LAILAGAAILVVLGIIILPRLDWSSSTDDTDAEQKGIVLSNYRAADVSSMTITTADGPRTYVLNDEDKWVIEGMDDFDVNQELAADMAYNASYLKGEEIIAQNLDEKAKFGLDKPQVTVHTVFTDGSEITYYIGAISPSKTTYYAYMEGDDRIISLWNSYYSSLTYSLEDLQTFDLLDLMADNIVRIHVERPDQPIMEFTKKTGDQNVGLLVWWVTQPWVHQCEVSTLRETLDALVYIEPERVIDSNPSDLSKYGLDAPFMVLSLENKDGTVYTLRFGDKASSMYYYFMIDGDNRVFTTTSSRVDVINVSPFSMTDKYLSLITISKVSQMEFKGLGENAKVGIRQVERLDENGEVALNTAGEPIYDSEFTLDGKVTNQRAGEAWYEACLSVRLHSALEEDFTPVGAPDATLVYTFSEGDAKEYTFEFFSYKQDYYAVRINGEMDFLVRREGLQTIVDTLAQYRSGALDQ
jgi:hypothetical protein